MALPDRNPYTILISGVMSNERVSESVSSEVKHRAGVAITPGMQIEMYANSNELKWRPNASATEIAELAIAIDKPEEKDNTGIDDVIAIGENVHAVYLIPGDEFWTKCVSGQTVTRGTLLQPNGNGWYKAATATTQDAMLGRFRSVEHLNSGSALTVDTRCRVRFIG